MNLEDKMLALAKKCRARAALLRDRKGEDEHFNEQYALLWDAVADDIEETIRNHQDRT